MSSSLPVAISYSGGASSEWLVQAVIHGWLPRPPHLAVFFADTGEEHDWTYEAAARVEATCAQAEIPFFRCARKDSLSAHLLSLHGKTRADHPPLWIKKHGGGVGRAQHRCTREFKVAPMRRAQAAWLDSLGLPKSIIKWVGFGADEAMRAQKALAKQDVLWETLDFPVIRAGLTRKQQREQLSSVVRDVPRFSMCTFCPFKDPRRWLETPRAQLDRVYAVDEAVRNLDELGLTEGEAYLSSQLIPIRRLIKHGDMQPSLPGIELGCDAGACFL